jgi:putative ATP-dependent endonuclease of the OLD family
MKATGLTIRRYRAFAKEVKIDLDGFTVLTGPNNLGKSTVLLALQLFFSAFSGNAPIGFTRLYKLERDYPALLLRKRGRRYPTRISIDFSASESDFELEEDRLQFDIPSIFTVNAEFGASSRVQITITPELPKDAVNFLLRAIAARVRYVYIPTGRGVTSSRGVGRADVQNEIARLALSKVRNTRKRIKALLQLVEDAKGELKTLQADLAAELRRFMPGLKTIEFEIEPPDPANLIRITDILLDDGAKTALSQKGDGVKNLLSIAVLQYVASQDPGDQLILGIEEPEAHLHSEAIYKLKPQLKQLSLKHNVLLTTHSPILVQREDISKNLIVDQELPNRSSSQVRRARSLADIRRSLGIKPQENMLTAEVILVVEGDTERRVLEALFRDGWARLKASIEEGRIRVLPSHGASKVVLVLRTIVRDATSCVVLLDNDAEGRRAKEEIMRGGLCSPSDLFMIPTREGIEETEFEDLFDPSVYLPALNSVCGTSMSIEDFEEARRRSGSKVTRMKKWSNVVASILTERGKDWEMLREAIREAMAGCLVDKAKDVSAKKLVIVKELASRIEALLREEGAAR